jgi:hypothetical protein
MWRVRRRAVAAAICVTALVIGGCSNEEASESDRLEDAIRELAEAGAPHRTPDAAPVDAVVCEPLVIPTYACEVHYGERGDIALFPFCAELRDDALYMNSEREGCGPSSRGHIFGHATADDFG